MEEASNLKLLAVPSFEKLKRDRIQDYFERTTDLGNWKAVASRIVARKRIRQTFRLKFQIYWTMAGHHIRAQIGDDRILVTLLKVVLPKYDGPDMVLFRGENADRLTINRVGMCWSASEGIARMFGRGLNAMHSGGVLLKCQVPAEAIIAGPSNHSRYLGEEEFTVDSALLSRVEIMERYPPLT